MSLLQLLFVYPAIVATFWTILAVLFMHRHAVGSTLPVWVGCHPIAMLQNPKDETHVAKPTVLATAGALVAGIFVGPFVLAVGAVYLYQLLTKYRKSLNSRKNNLNQ